SRRGDVGRRQPVRPFADAPQRDTNRDGVDRTAVLPGTVHHSPYLGAGVNVGSSPFSFIYTNAMHTGAGVSSVTLVFVSTPVERSILNTTVTPLFCPSAKT